MNKAIIFIFISTAFLSGASESKSENRRAPKESLLAKAIREADLPSLHMLILDVGMNPHEVDSDGQTLLEIAQYCSKLFQTRYAETAHLAASPDYLAAREEQCRVYKEMIEFLTQACCSAPHSTASATGAGAGVRFAGSSSSAGSQFSADYYDAGCNNKFS